MAELIVVHSCRETEMALTEGDQISHIIYYLPCRPGVVYVNVTDSCLNECRFCIKREGPIFFGQNLSLRGEDPNHTEILRALLASPGWPSTNEVVFCGMGEPLLRYDCVLKVCKAIKKMSGKNIQIRVDTSGLHWSTIKRLEFLEYIDILSVSLNAETPEKYEELCQPKIENAYSVLMDFLKTVKKYEEKRKKQGLPFPEVRLSVVDTSEEDFIPLSGREGYSKGKFPVPDLETCQKITAAFGWIFIIKRLFRDNQDVRWDNKFLEAVCIYGAVPETCENCPYRH